MQTPSRHSSFLLCTQAAVTLDFPACRFYPQSRKGAIVWQPNPNLPLRQNRQRYAGTLLVFLECYSSRSRPWLLPLPWRSALERPSHLQAALYRLLCRSEEHTSELQSHLNLVCRLLLEKKKKQTHI